jgi:peptidoglycan-associated lipoprotein
MEAVDSSAAQSESEPPVESLRPALSESISSVNGQLEDVFFPSDQFELSNAAITALRRDADLLRTILRDFLQLQITVEGHCDERGSAEYNLGLGDRRAARALSFLTQIQFAFGQFAPVSYGKEAPQYTERTESCWSRNRRVHVVVRVNATN